jgi:hypothetical protein
MVLGLELSTLHWLGSLCHRLSYSTSFCVVLTSPRCANLSQQLQETNTLTSGDTRGDPATQH